VPQIGGMHEATARASSAVDYGFRLPARSTIAPDFEEFLSITPQMGSSARRRASTSAPIRPRRRADRPSTGIVTDGRRPGDTQPDRRPHDEVRQRVDKNERVLVTTLTRR